MRFSSLVQAALVAFELSGCAGAGTGRAGSSPAAQPPPGSPWDAPPESSQSAAGNAPPQGPAAATAGPTSTGVAPAMSGPERHGPPLPELSVKSFGLHVGGSAADAAAREDFLRALEAAAPRYLDCYRLVEQPGVVGTFGVDLTLGGNGGHARAGKPRTKLRGEAFEACMLRALESVSFGRPPSGRSVVVSYSVKFKLSD